MSNISVTLKRNALGLVLAVLGISGCGGNAGSGGNTGTSSPTAFSVSGVYSTVPNATATPSAADVATRASQQSQNHNITIILAPGGSDAGLSDSTAGINCSSGTWDEVVGMSTSNITDVTGTFTNCAGPNGAIPDIPFTGSYTTPPNPSTGEVTLTGNYSIGTSSVGFVSIQNPLTQKPITGNPLNATYTAYPCPTGSTTNYTNVNGIEVPCGASGSITLTNGVISGSFTLPTTSSIYTYDATVANSNGTTSTVTCTDTNSSSGSVVLSGGVTPTGLMNNVYSSSATTTLNINVSDIISGGSACGQSLSINADGSFQYNGFEIFFQDSNGATHVTITGNSTGNVNITVNGSTTTQSFTTPINSTF